MPRIFFLKKTGPLAIGLRRQSGRKNHLARNSTRHVYWRNSLKRPRPIPTSVKNRGNAHIGRCHCIGCYISGSGNRQFARLRHSASAPSSRKIAQSFHGRANLSRHFQRCRGIIFCDVGTNRLKIRQGRWGPDQLHLGKGSSLSVPQLSSQATTCSWEKPLPASNSANPV